MSVSDQWRFVDVFGECKPNCLNRIVKIDLSEIDLNFNQLTLFGKCNFQTHCCKYLGTYRYKLSINGNAYMLRKSRHARLTYVNLFQQLIFDYECIWSMKVCSSVFVTFDYECIWSMKVCSSVFVTFDYECIKYWATNLHWSDTLIVKSDKYWATNLHWSDTLIVKSDKYWATICSSVFVTFEWVYLINEGL
jgi:hypothetical protein